MSAFCDQDRQRVRIVNFVYFKIINLKAVYFNFEFFDL